MGGFALLPVVGAMTVGVGITVSGGGMGSESVLGTIGSGLPAVGGTSGGSTCGIAALAGPIDGGIVPPAWITGSTAGAGPLFDDSTFGIVGRLGA